VPSGIGSIPHTEQLQDSDQLYYKVTFLEDHRFIVTDSANEYKFNVRPTYCFTVYSGMLLGSSFV
jgi:hypothetical protein